MDEQKSKGQDKDKRARHLSLGPGGRERRVLRHAGEGGEGLKSSCDQPPHRRPEGKERGT